MPNNNYNKPPLDSQEHIDFLKKRNLLFSEDDEIRRAPHYLKHIGYQRLKIYFHDFATNSSETFVFKDNISFSDIINLYNFDRQLRLIIMDAIERIEISIKSVISNKTCLAYNDSFWYLSCINYKNVKFYKTFMEIVADKLNDKFPDEVIKYYNDKYSNDYPPFWKLKEILTFGEISQLYKNLHNNIKRQISDEYNLKPIILESWLHSMAHLRNLCAHHSKIWNRSDFSIKPKKPRKMYNMEKYFKDNKKLFCIISILAYFMNLICSNSDWKKRIIEHIKKDSYNFTTKNGFPENWDTYELWKT
ncbi:Abi family protein [Deferribacter autotrophicus]|uniref:Abi family protein n=1 Tax=Deferribacter autotrophicus TaxID=500465 RepID=A0A5A8F375_9BACT|nr:Abi family protein [Deferribacter autotrophicus]KAA0258253.1 Abi family protein [Deferribacter autotrophicus]